ncbi:hypothetical protein RJ640_008705 [Escallonia rubra]|uniref:Retrotransposon gag domain-containing protein n=1 Tax=Escallonia rubra TaxID=112253 RepID=A0AA88RMZ3_9ASTE|nr:hypothetical protein RJ640_008705 [Escallonia rubra]
MTLIGLEQDGPAISEEFCEDADDFENELERDRRGIFWCGMACITPSTSPNATFFLVVGLGTLLLTKSVLMLLGSDEALEYLCRNVVRSAIGFTVFTVLLGSWALTFAIGGERLLGHVWNELVMYNFADKYGLTDTNVQEVVNEGNVRGAQQVEQPQEMLNTAQMLGDGGLTLDRFVKLIKNPFFGKPDPTFAEEWLARAEKILDTARISNSQRLVYTSFMLEASAERWWKLLSMKWEREGVPSTWENFKREFTNKYVLAVTQEMREVNFIKFEQRNMSVSVYESQFTDLAKFCPHLVDTEERKVRKFVKGLNKDLRDKLIPLQLQTYMAVVNRALAIENDLEEQKNVDT